MNKFTDRLLAEEMLEPAPFLRQVLGQAFDKLDEELRHLLLATSQRRLEKVYSKLRKLGILHEKIVSSPMLLGRDPAIMQRNYNFLVKKGFDQQFIVDIAEILCLNPNLVKNPDFLKKLRRMKKIQSPIPEGEVKRTADLVWKRSREKITASPVRLRLVR